MDFRAWNRRKNNWLRLQRGKIISLVLGKKPFVPYDARQVKKILVLRNDNKLGDMLVSSVLFRGLRQLFPNGRIDVAAGEANACLARENKKINHIYYASESLGSLFLLGCRLRKERYDLYLDLNAVPTLSSLVFLKILNPRWAFGFNRKAYPLYNFTQEVDLTRMHITQRYEAALRYAGFEGNCDLSYELNIPESAEQAAQRLMATLPGPGRVLALCPYGASRHRSFSAGQIAAVARAFASDKIILLGQPGRLKTLMKGQSLPNVFIFEGEDLFQSVALLKRADWVLTVDTFWVHAACALQKRTLAAYQDKGENWAVWHPNYEGVKPLFCEGEQSKLPPERLVEALKSL